MPEESERKPMLTVPEQIEHLKEKGVAFDLCPEDDAAEYLTFNNNYFRLASYRKNYDKYTAGERAGKYVNLDFAYLKDLAIIDMQLRYTCLPLCLDIEHYAKLEILRKAEAAYEDGYQIVRDFMASLGEEQLKRTLGEIGRNRNSVYCGDIFDKYGTRDLPLWVFLEMVPFGRLVTFYKFCAVRYRDKDMLDRHYILKACKDIRNAAAHSSCILNDLRPGRRCRKANHAVTAKLAGIGGLKPDAREKRMSNVRIQEIVSLLFVHPMIVSSGGVRIKAAKSLCEFSERLLKHIDYYETNKLVEANLLFLNTVIQAWFHYDETGERPNDRPP